MPECKVCGEILPDDAILRETKGQVTYTVDNKIFHNHLASDRAKEIRANATFSKAQKQTAKDMADALCEVIITPGEPREPALRLLIGELAKAASKDSSQSIRAIETALNMVGSPSNKMRKPRNDERCPLCERGPGGGLHLNTDPAQRVLDLLTNEGKWIILDRKEYEREQKTRERLSRTCKDD